MRTHVTNFDLRLRRRSLLGYTFGTAAYALIIVVLYPAFKSSTSLNDLVKSSSTAAALFGITGSITSPAGWLNANLYGNFLPLIMLLITIGYGASSLAGQDEEGTLSLAATLPMSRRRILGEKVVALVVQAFVLAVANMACMFVGRGFQLTIPFAHLLGATVGVALLGVDFGLAAMALGSWTGSRGAALGVASSLAAASYLVSSLAPVIHWMHPARFASLFYWSVGDAQLSRGLNVGSLGVLVAVGACSFALALWAFNRLDLH
ncbi:MAG TPA: ABC transporter permease subunit [Acidimicrobiales bacterium]|nr:ABC transporter permease subunit [Acidimicrobiales bacterium]